MNFFKLNFSAYLVFLAFIVGLIRFRRLTSTEKLVVLILLINLIADLISIQLKTSTLLYNISVFPEMLLSFIILLLHNRASTIRTDIIIGMSAFIGVYTLTFYAFDMNTNLNSLGYSIGGVLLAAVSFLDLRNTLNSQKPEMWKYNTIMWFSVANFLFYTIAMPFISAIPFIYAHAPELSKKLYPAMITTSYSLWTIAIIIGFLWKQN